MGEHARLAHLRDLGHGADRQAFQANLLRQVERGVDDHGLGLLPLLGRAGVFGGNGIEGHGWYKIKRTVVLFCTH